MTKKVIVSFDIEHDYNRLGKNFKFTGSNFLLKPLRVFLKDRGIRTNFFFSTDALIKFHRMAKFLKEEGHEIGVHSSFHDILCKYNYAQQFEQIFVATNVHKILLSDNPKIFRAPNFSINHDSIAILEKLKYEIDSSVLPGRKHLAIPNFSERLLTFYLPNIRSGMIPTYFDFSKAPLNSYFPSKLDVSKEGSSSVLEIPVASNISYKGIPISGGSLKKYGLEKDIKAIDNYLSDFVVLVYHPWEFIKLNGNQEVFDQELFNDFKSIIDYCINNHNIVTLSDLRIEHLKT